MVPRLCSRRVRDRRAEQTDRRQSAIYVYNKPWESDGYCHIFLFDRTNEVAYSDKFIRSRILLLMPSRKFMPFGLLFYMQLGQVNGNDENKVILKPTAPQIHSPYDLESLRHEYFGRPQTKKNHWNHCDSNWHAESIVKHSIATKGATGLVCDSLQEATSQLQVHPSYFAAQPQSWPPHNENHENMYRFE